MLLLQYIMSIFNRKYEILAFYKYVRILSLHPACNLIKVKYKSFKVEKEDVGV